MELLAIVEAFKQWRVYVEGAACNEVNYVLGKDEGWKGNSEGMNE